MAWAKHAADCGLTLEHITDQSLNRRDLSRKGGCTRQFEYAKRAARPRSVKDSRSRNPSAMAQFLLRSLTKHSAPGFFIWASPRKGSTGSYGDR